MKSKKICAAVIAALPAVVAAAACTALYTQTAAAEDLARLDLSAEWAPTWNKADTVGNVTVQQGMKIAIEELAELSNLSAATFSDSLAFQGKAPLKVTYSNSHFIGKNADNITIEGYDGDKIFDSTTGSFTFYIDADITAKTADNTTPLWTKTADDTYTYYRSILVKDYSGTFVSGELYINLKSVEKKQPESNSSEISTSSNSSSESSAASDSSSTASSSSSGSSNKVEPAYDYDTTTDDDNDTNDYAAVAAENPDTGIILVIAPVTLAAGAVVAAVCEKKK